MRDYFLKVGASYRTSAKWKREFVDDHQYCSDHDHPAYPAPGSHHQAILQDAANANDRDAVQQFGRAGGVADSDAVASQGRVGERSADGFASAGP